MLDQGELADPRIGLAQSHAVPLRQPHQLLAGPVQQLGVGGERHVLGLHRGVDDHPGQFGRLDRLGLDGDRQALLDQRRQPLLAHALAPARQRRAVEHQLVLEELLAAEELVIRVLDPALAQHLVGQIVGVLEDRQPRHQPRRQRRPAGIVVVNLAEPLFQKAPVDRAPQRHQRMVHVDDLIEPRAEQILLPRLATLSWPHRIPRQSRFRASKSQIKFARNPAPKARFPANPTTAKCRFRIPNQRLGNSSRTTNVAASPSPAQTVAGLEVRQPITLLENPRSRTEIDFTCYRTKCNRPAHSPL